MIVTITKIHRSDKSKDGKPFINKNGLAYTRLAIQTREHGQKWLSGFDSKMTADWQEGQEVDIEVTENGEYLNFKVLSETQKLWQAYNEVLKRLVRLEAQMKRIESQGDQRDQGDYQEPGHVEDVNGELMASKENNDLPF